MKTVVALLKGLRIASSSGVGGDTRCSGAREGQTGVVVGIAE